MSTYEVEHNTTDPGTATPSTHRRRPDLSTFFATLSEISPDEARTREHAVPVPRDVSAAFYSLAEAFDLMRREGDHSVPTSGEGDNDLLTQRVPKASLKPSQSCPICGNAFLEDQYPLVVRLPCHSTHLFDLECVRPWLRLRGTCPLDRTDFAKQEREKAEARRKKPVEDDEEEWDGMYG
ncbi:hypothetical protein AFCA_003196 [Aspergillus flavus]|nr:hypothetical protein AFCA_003196 [Aspergillus flavus]